MFLLAVIGYAGLTVSAILAARGRVWPFLWRATAAVIVAHVALVWSIRYEWSWAQATRNGYAGAVIFHGALAVIVTSLFVRGALAARLIAASFVIVTLGALGAVFRYEDVARYRLIVISLAVVGVVGLIQSRNALHAHRNLQER